jgi:hypothetical protein
MKRIIKASIVIVAVAVLVGGAYAGIDRWQDKKEQQAAEKRELDDLRKKAFRLLDEYNACKDKLNRDYPNGRTEDNKDTYEAADKKCAAIRTKQNATAKEHNSRAGVR